MDGDLIAVSVDVDVRRDDNAIEGRGEAIVDIVMWSKLRFTSDSGSHQQYSTVL